MTAGRRPKPKPDPKYLSTNNRARVASLSGHPMEKRAVDALLDGQTMRQVAAFLKPRLSYASVNRYYKRILEPTLIKAESLQSVLPEQLTKEKRNAAPIKDTVGDEMNDNCNDENDDEVKVKPYRPVAPGSGSELGKFTSQAILSAPLLHIREGRIKAKIERHRRMQMIVEERAQTMGHVPGGSSGLLSPNTEEFDSGLNKAFEEAEKNIAIELGQWQENNLAGTGMSVQIVMPASPGDAPRVSFATGDTILLDDGGFEEIGVVQR